MHPHPAAEQPVTPNETIKAESHHLRGNLAKEMADTSTGAISEESGQLTKFHGLYLQDDRDQRLALKKAGKEKAFSFMLRVRLPGGRATPQQWLVLDQLSEKFASPSLRITTRQTFQFHGILKGRVKPLVQGMHTVLLDSIAACGDVNRNVMAPPNPERSELLQQVYDHARAWSEFALPKTRAYHEIWLDDELVAGGEEKEPMYGPTYLPRKFKTAFALPPHNDVDIFSQDLGYIAIVEDGKLVGYNVTVGGGLGMSHGNNETHPRLADVLGFIPPTRSTSSAKPSSPRSAITAAAPTASTPASSTPSRTTASPGSRTRSRSAPASSLATRAPSTSPASRTRSAGTRASTIAGSTASTSSADASRTSPTGR